MQSGFLRLLSVALLAVTVAFPAARADSSANAEKENVSEAADESITVSLSTAYMSRYVWRGIVTNPDPVFQPSATVAYKGFSLNVWGNMDCTNYTDTDGDFNEVDVTFGYAHTWDKLTLSVGNIYYAFPNTDFKETNELYAGLALDVILKPSIKAYWDYDEVGGTYVSFDIAHSFKLPEFCLGSTKVGWSVDLGNGVGWMSTDMAEFYFGTDNSGWSDYHASLAIPFAIGEHWVVAPSLAYSDPMGDDFDSFQEHHSVWTSGLTVTCNF